MEEKNIKNFFSFIEEKEKKGIPDLVELFYFPEKWDKNKKYLIEGRLRINEHQCIKKLPNNLTVHGNFNIDDSNITELPENLTIYGYFSIENTLIESLPQGLKFIFNESSLNPLGTKHIFIFNTPLSEKYSDDEIRKILNSDNLNIVRTHVQGIQ
jgi:hypothetical protein